MITFTVYAIKSIPSKNIILALPSSADLTPAQAEAGVTFDNSFFDNSIVFLQQFKNRSFLGTFTGQHLSSINSNFDFELF